MSDIWLPFGVTEGPAHGGEEWRKTRLGLVTASRFGDVMTEPRSKAAKEAGELSETAKGYLYEIVTQVITGQECIGGTSAAMDRGKKEEGAALGYYAETRMVDVRKGRLIILDGLGIGATPDGFVEDDPDGPGIVEVKCPESRTHLMNWTTKKVPKEYIDQVQGQLWVTGRSWCDFVSYDDRVPFPIWLSVVRVSRDEHHIAELRRRVIAFSEQVSDRIAAIRSFRSEASPVARQIIHQALENDPTGAE